MDPRRSLKARLLLVTFGMVLLLSTVLSLVVGHISTEQLEASANQSLEELAFQVADKLDRGMFGRYRDLQILASLDVLRQPSASVAAERKLLEQLQKSYPNYAWLGVADPAGIVRVSTGGLLEGESVAQRAWFQVGRKQPFVGDVHEAFLLEKLLSNPTNEPLRFVDLSTPLLDKQGQLQGVLAAHLSWEWAKEITRQLINPETKHNRAEILIVSQDGYVLLGPAGVQGETLPITLLKNSNTNRTGYFIESWSSQGEFVTGFASTKGYLDYPGLGWIVLARRSVAQAFAPVRALQAKVLGWGLGIGMLFALLSWLIARRISFITLKLTAAANHIQQGSPDETLPTIGGRDELAQLSRSLSHMVNMLQTQRQNLLLANQHLQDELQQRQLAERKIREQAALLDIATDAIFVRDLDHRIVYWNKGAQRIYGWSAAEACGQNAITFLNQEHSPELDTAMQTVLEQGEWQGELEKVTQSKQVIVVDSRWSLARNAAGQPKFILTVDTDITKQKQLEAQFLRAQRLENLGTLASGIAHDLNNIFTPIMGSAGLLPITLDPADNKSRRLVQMLNDSAQRGSELVKQILAFARGAEGKFMSLQVGHLLAEIQQIIKSTFPKCIELQANIPNESLPMVLADATQLHQVLMNLCVNARDAMPNGGILSLSAKAITVDEHFAKIHVDANTGEYVAITVADTGMGIPPRLQERIFDPFFTTKEIGQGTGLGLSTVKGIIKVHGGFLSLYSEVSRGTTFTVFIPTELGPETETPESPELRKGQRELILVVDDEALIQQMAKSTLELFNYRVITARNGIEAITQYKLYHPDLVLMDMMMPELDGQGAISALKDINPHLKIIATSGLIAEQPAASSVDAFLPKPYTLQELLHALGTVL
ncbi:ATP-binding protein [Acaryochloris sp. CCMEE 5410]|uniref:hybrid sensor histidine kinase/response regulator n=1 Tax=Acaryochloris sp. CCMEE 5410 TaxID=310037 RepID=UPI0002EDEBA2|nr:ATP-binding protein [Acaryochloris sp. CCMEE 5410]KAI9129275.1 PAS domain S-box protein [Acaryochloris sp. CCMEE 5410]